MNNAKILIIISCFFLLIFSIIYAIKKNSFEKKHQISIEKIVDLKYESERLIQQKKDLEYMKIEEPTKNAILDFLKKNDNNKNGK